MRSTQFTLDCLSIQLNFKRADFARVTAELKKDNAHVADAYMHEMLSHLSEAERGIKYLRDATRFKDPVD